jgi:hypothetical protein
MERTTISPALLRVITGGDFYEKGRSDRCGKSSFVTSSEVFVNQYGSLGVHRNPEDTVNVQWWSSFLAFDKYQPMRIAIDGLVGVPPGTCYPVFPYFGEQNYSWRWNDGEPTQYYDEDLGMFVEVQDWQGVLGYDPPEYSVAIETYAQWPHPILAFDNWSTDEWSFDRLRVLTGAFDVFSLDPSRQAGLDAAEVTDLTNVVAIPLVDAQSYYELSPDTTSGSVLLSRFVMDGGIIGRRIRFRTEGCSANASVTLTVLDSDGIALSHYTTVVTSNTITDVLLDGLSEDFSPRFTLTRNVVGTPSPRLLWVEVEWDATEDWVAYVPPDRLTLPTDDHWTFTGNTITVAAPRGIRTSVEATVYSANGGTLRFTEV